MALFERTQIQRKAVIFLTVVMLFAGISLMLQMPVGLFPDITFPRIVVLIDNGEEPAERMMVEVTKPIEEVVSSLPGLRSQRSVTSRGSAEISIFLEWGSNVQQTLQILQGRIANIRNTLPSEANVEARAMSVSVFPVEGYSLTSSTRSLVELRDIALYKLRPAILKVPGVQRIEITGGETREFEVRIDPNKLYGYHLDVRTISDALKRTNFVASTGLVDNNYQLYLSLVNGLLKTTDDIRSVVISTANGVPIHVSDIASVEPAVADQFLRTSAHGRDAVLIDVMKQPTGSTVAIGQGVQEVLKQIKLPADVHFENFYDQAGYIKDSIDGTRDAILIGIALAMLVLLLFLRSWRVTLVIAIVVPATIAGTFVCLYAINESINIMTLGGIAAAVGLLIDDSIVIIESIFTHFATQDAMGGAKRDVFRRSANSSLKEVMPAVIGSTLSTIVIHIPLGFLSGITGAFFRSLSITMVFALVLSFVLSITLAPLLASGFLRKKDMLREVEREHKRSRLGESYGLVMARLLRYPWLSIPLTLALLLGSYFLYAQLGSGFMPEMDEGSFVLDYSSPPGTSLSETSRMLRNVEQALMKTPEVEAYSRRTGTQLGFFLTEQNAGDYAVKLKHERSRSIDEVINDVRARVGRIEPRLRIDFGQILQDVIGDLTNNPSPVEIKIFGADQSVMQAKAKEVYALIQNVPGVVDAFNGIVISGPSLVIDVDARKASFYGLTSSDVQQQLETMMRGTAGTSILMKEKLIGVRVRFPKSYHFDMDSIGQALLTAPSGTLIPISSVATMHRTAGEAEIDREGLEQYVAVTSRIEGRDLGSTINDIRAVLQKKLVLPSTMRIEYGGVYQTQQESFRSLLLVAIAALVLVFIVLLIEFREFSSAFMIILITLLSIFGVFAALALTGTTLNISSFVGLIMIIGIVAENAVFIVHYAKLPEYRHLGPSGAIIKATRYRMRPIVMTTLAAVLALLPLALSLGSGAQMQQSLAIAVIGGFSVSTLLLFLLLPLLYSLFHKETKHVATEM